MRTPISYYGGKQTMLKHILPLIPRHRIYTEAFGNGKLGYASALSYVLLIMTLIVGLIQLYTNNKHEKEEIA